MTNADNELISVIMPAYNAEKTLGQAVKSVLDQTYPFFELIVINDCSLDRTASLAKQYALMDSRVRVLENGVNSGASRTRHKGVEAARGRWLAFLDSDDAWARDKLEKQIAVQKERQAKLVYTGSAFMNADGVPLNWILHVPVQIGYRKLLRQNLISNSSVLILKDCYLRFEALGDGMHEDFACWLRLLRSGETAYGIDEPLLIYRLSPSSKSGNKLRAAMMNWNSYRAVGMSALVASYYMVWYAINGLLKYAHLREVVSA